MNKTALVAAIALVNGAGTSQAAFVTSGTAEAVTFRSCIPGLTACDDIASPVLTNYGGSPGASSSAAAGSVGDIGAGAGSVSLSGTVGAPILKASADSLPGGRVNTNSIALQSYTYTGSSTETRTFSGTLTYSQDLTGSYPSEANTGIFASIWIFSLSVPAVDVGATPESNFKALFSFDFPGFTLLASQSFSNLTSTTAGSATFGATVSLAPGQTIWVDVLLQTPAVNGSRVDASDTFVTAWDNALNLAPAAAVPEPATFSLLFFGLAGLVLTRRSHMKNVIS